MRRHRLSHGFALLTLLAVMAAGCDSGGGGGGGAPSPRRQAEDTDGEQEDDEETGDRVEAFVESRNVSGVSSYQKLAGQRVMARNFLQLRAAGAACLGPGLGLVNDTMFAAGRCPGQAAVAPAPAGGEIQPILGQDKCGWRGSDIFDLLQDQLWSPTKAARSDTLTAEVTPAYLQALAMSADILAHGVSEPMSLCDTPERTRALLQRCLPLVPAARVEEAVGPLSAACAQGALSARGAIAAVIGSAAFAAAVLPEEAGE